MVSGVQMSLSHPRYEILYKDYENKRSCTILSVELDLHSMLNLH